MRRALVAAACMLGACAASATRPTTLNIVPHGNEAPGVPWAAAPGMLPAETQAKMYDRITPLFRGVTDDVLRPSTDGTGYYKSAALLPRTTRRSCQRDRQRHVAERGRRQRADQARPLRRPAHLQRHRRGRDLRRRLRGRDRPALLLGQARYNGVAGLIDMPGVPAINLVLGLYDYKPSKQVVEEVTTQQTKSIEARARRASTAQRHRHLRRGHQRAVRRRPARRAASSRAPTSTR